METLNWDDFWEAKLEATFNQRTQTALDAYEITAADCRLHTVHLLRILEGQFPDCEFAAENSVGDWGIYVRTRRRRPVPQRKREKIASAAGAILENIEKKYPIKRIREKRHAETSKGCGPAALTCGCLLAVIALAMVLVAIAALAL